MKGEKKDPKHRYKRLNSSQAITLQLVKWKGSRKPTAMSLYRLVLYICQSCRRLLVSKSTYFLSLDVATSRASLWLVSSEGVASVVLGD